MRKLVLIFGIFMVAAIGIFLFNFLSLQMPVAKEINEDPRNIGINVCVHLKYYMMPNKLVYDIRKIAPEASRLDVFRAFLQSASALQEKDFNTVFLSSQGNHKFFIEGVYFKELGKEYELQNPIYTSRMFPENLFSLLGEKAYSEWSGGLLGVVTAQMDDFLDACDEWFFNDFIE